MSEQTNTPALGAKCACLRSKSSYGAFGEFHEHLEDILGATTTYWCLKTMGKAGPDEHYAHGSLCRAGRRCWEDPESA
jgi:hypothetical protein